MEIEPNAAILFAGLAGAAVLVLLLGVAAAVFGIMRLNATEHFRCPFLRRDVEAKFEEWGGRRQAVLRCSAFGPGDEIDCGTPCLVSEDIVPRTAG